MALTALLNLISANATQQGSLDRITGAELRAILNAIVNTIQGDVPFSTSIPFDKNTSKMATHQLVGNITLTPNSAGAAGGFGTVVRIVGGGSYSVTLSGFKKSSISGNFVATSGVVNVFVFLFDGTDYWYSIFQEAGTSSGGNQTPTQLSAPVINITSGTATPVVLDWADITGATQYQVQRATDSGFTQNLLTIATPSVSTQTDASAAAGTTYYYRVKCSGTGYTDSAYSNVVSVTVAAASPTTDADATAAITRRETASGATLSTTWKNALHQLFTSGKAGANWMAKVTQLYIAPGDNLAGSYINLKAANKNLSAGSAPTYSATDGWTFGGGDTTPQHLLTGLTPSTEFGGNWSVGLFTKTDVAALSSPTQYAFGSYVDENSAIDFAPGISASEGRAHAYNANSFTKPVSGVGGWMVGYGASYATPGLAIYKESTLIHNAATGGTLPTQNLAIGGRNVSGSGVIQGAPMNMWAFFVAKDDEMTEAEWQQMVTNMNTFKTAVGI